MNRICTGLDEIVAAFRDRSLEHTSFPYVWLDATYLHVRAEKVTSMAVVIAMGVTPEGRREIVGLEVGDSEDEAFWRASSVGSSAGGFRDAPVAGKPEPALCFRVAA